MTLGNRLKLGRKSLGLSQEQLAAVAGIGANAQGHYESGFRVPRASYFAALSALGLDVQYIVLGVRNRPYADLVADEAQFIQALRLLDAEDRDAIGRILATMARGR